MPTSSEKQSKGQLAPELISFSMTESDLSTSVSMVSSSGLFCVVSVVTSNGEEGGS